MLSDFLPFLTRWRALLLLVISACLLTNCSPETKHPLFTEIKPEESGVRFENNLRFDQKFNIYTYRNFYNGGGVALGDVNNDGLIDIYLTANQGPNRLFLNKGDLKFLDITESARVAGTKAWSTGVSMADVNGDGWLDIYVCNSGDIKGDNKENELFINNGDLTFKEAAREYGIADRGFSTHAAFFDYDKDGDLDLYILNNSYQAIGSFNLRKNIRAVRDSLGGDKLFRNDGGHFLDVSEQAGIYGSVIGFGLGVTVGDVNKDGWQDIYVSNDFFERDYLYINNQNGTFKECLPEQMRSISGASMGADFADINNDGMLDLFVTEMLPRSNERIKTVTTFEDWNRYQYNLSNSYYHQFTRNMLQLNNGDGTFSEIGRLAGVEATDWSWGALIFDMDNDGWKDIFVANGIYQDLTNQDFLAFASSEEFVKSVVSKNQVDFKKLTEVIPSTPVPNFAFQNVGEGKVFLNKAEEWGLGKPGFSNGSAYGDLDNDGDLDIVVNHVNSNASVFRNNAETQVNNNFIKFNLKGNENNPFAIGTQIEVYDSGKYYYVEQMPIRGFESSMDPRPNIGLGKCSRVDSVIIKWPDGKVTKMVEVESNQILNISQSDAGWNPKSITGVGVRGPKKPSSLSFILRDNKTINFVHKENQFVDFDRDKLMYYMISTEGPRMCTADINGDGNNDIYIGGAKGQAGSLFLSSSSSWVNWPIAALVNDKGSEDMGATFVDVDSDGDKDLYVCSGGYEFSNSSTDLQDRLYFNMGNGNWTKSPQLLPSQQYVSTSVVEAADVDADGDQDLFVGGRVKPFAYGRPMNGYILINDGKGNFSDETTKIAPDLTAIGMITDGQWSDIDGDKDYDLIVVGEYMPIVIFENVSGKLQDASSRLKLSKSNGLWNRIKQADFDNDGDMDFIIGNLGLNSRLKADKDHALSMYVGDFDKNGSTEQIVCMYFSDKEYPLTLRHDLISQLPYLKRKYIKYENYKDQSIDKVFTKDQLEEALHLQAFNLNTSVLINNGSKAWDLRPLPLEAQYSITFGIGVYDFNEDGYQDLLLGGNLNGVKPEIGRYDASYGELFLNDHKGNFRFVPNREVNLSIDGEVRDIVILESGNKPQVIISRNNNSVLTYEISREEK